MTERTITVKMAKPSKEDFDRVLNFFQGIEMMLEEGAVPLATDEDEPGEDATPERALDWLEEKWKKVRMSWSRVLWAGKVAIDNCCDPDGDVLEWHPKVTGLLSAAQVGLEALVAIQDKDDGSLVSPARHDLTKAIEQIGI